MSKVKGVYAKAKKKTASASAIIKKGVGRITINKRNIKLINPRYLYEFVHEPLDFVGQDFLNDVDISINVKGGGYMAQAIAARAVIAKAIVNYTNDPKLKDEYTLYDRTLLVDDFRRKESKKQLGRGARAKKQLSFR
ncbi:MAG: 30S ribosomal protein S9 [Candidatus Diapherotrites archaeon]|nr:30S ribosomal protein S9 [Candidatus Diapherotrites archaeon]